MQSHRGLVCEKRHQYVGKFSQFCEADNIETQIKNIDPDLIVPILKSGLFYE